MKIFGRALLLAKLVSSPYATKRDALIYSPPIFSILFSSSATRRRYSESTTRSFSSLDKCFVKKKLTRSVSSGISDDCPRPMEIPWQVKVANKVSLIGSVEAPVQFLNDSDGKQYAQTTIYQYRDATLPHSSALRIPITFEGDLAYVAACHLKVKDLIHIEGKLNEDASGFKNSQTNIQVVVESLNFVQKSLKSKKSAVPGKSTNSKEATLSSWRHLIDNPKLWSDYRTHKKTGLVKPRYPDFRSTDGKEALWLDGAPDWVLSGLHQLEFNVPENNSKVNVVNSTNVGESTLPAWKNLIENPNLWCDYRPRKQMGLVSAKYPDFKSKDGKQCLWLPAPQCFVSELHEIKFDEEDLWRSLTDRPVEWWDNRNKKKEPNSPDFKNKSTGSLLWLKHCPAWAKSKYNIS